MVILDVIVVLVGGSLLIAPSYGLFKLFTRVDDIFEGRNNARRVLYGTIAIVLFIISITTLCGMIFYFLERSISVIPTQETIKTILDIALGYTFMVLAYALLFSTWMMLMYSSSEKTNKSKSVLSAIVIWITIIISCGLLSYLVYNIYINTNTLSDLINGCAEERIWDNFEIILFGRSAPSIEDFIIPESWAWIKKDPCNVSVPFSSIDLNDYPIKISQAYAHFSSVFYSWGINSVVAKIASISLPIISFIADVLGIAGFIEAIGRRRLKKQKNET